MNNPFKNVKLEPLNILKRIGILIGGIISVPFILTIGLILLALIPSAIVFYDPVHWIIFGKTPVIDFLENMHKT